MSGIKSNEQGHIKDLSWGKDLKRMEKHADETEALARVDLDQGEVGHNDQLRTQDLDRNWENDPERNEAPSPVPLGETDRPETHHQRHAELPQEPISEDVTEGLDKGPPVDRRP